MYFYENNIDFKLNLLHIDLFNLFGFFDMKVYYESNIDFKINQSDKVVMQ